MSKRTKSNLTWTLTILRNGKQGHSKRLEEAVFQYGRSQSEVPESQVSRIPTGLITAVERSGLEGEALETGFLVEMSTRPQTESAWLEFASTATVSDKVPWGRSRTLYATPLDTTLEFIEIGSFCSSSMTINLPPRIWVRALELPLSTVAWAMSNGIYESGKSRQIGLGEWVEFSNPPETPDVEILPLPGPVEREYNFL
jgi:hypothetical protein